MTYNTVHKLYFNKKKLKKNLKSFLKEYFNKKKDGKNILNLT